MKKVILQFGLLATALLGLLELSKYSLQYQFLKEEFWTPLFGVLFIIIGMLLSRLVKTKKPDKKTTGMQESPEIAHSKITELGISNREYEVLQKIAEGHSNLEIAQKLFISESTVKTHVSNLLVKLDAKRRTQAVKNAKTLKIL